MGPTRISLPGQRWHFAHGPIELVIGAEGETSAVQDAHEMAWQRFQTVLTQLVAELPLLRQPVAAGACPVQGVVARRMWQACAALPTDFITPMAAVAGSVAQEIVQVYADAGLPRVYVNNGGDIALHLAAGESWRVGLVADIARRQPALDGHFTVHGTGPVRGIATSGWRGRSHSLGIADAVTVLAATATQADAAATVVANAVNIEDAAIRRAPACSLRDDSDLGERLVTVSVPPLAPQQVMAALQRGAHVARHLQAAGCLYAAALTCQGRIVTITPAATSESLPLAA